MPSKGLGLSSDPIVIAGKSLDAIKASKDRYTELITLFGGKENLPSSIMRAVLAKPTKENRDESVINRGLYEKKVNGEYLSKDRTIPKELRRALHVSGSGCTSGALSTFPQNVGRSIVLLYSDPGSTVLDPFAGHNSRMELCVKAGRNYIGCDLSTDFMKANRKRAEHLRGHYPHTAIELHRCDSRKIPVADNVGDFTLTSPPYYDIEYYGDEPEQLGKATTYRKFLKGIRRVLAENFRVLKPNAFAVWFINDFRRKGRMHFYHKDIIDLGTSVGFTPFDLLVVDFGRGIRDCFLGQVVDTRILPKRHEFGIVFRKPDNS